METNKNQKADEAVRKKELEIDRIDRQLQEAKQKEKMMAVTEARLQKMVQQEQERVRQKEAEIAQS